MLTYIFSPELCHTVADLNTFDDARLAGALAGHRRGVRVALKLLDALGERLVVLVELVALLVEMLVLLQLLLELLQVLLVLHRLFLPQHLMVRLLLLLLLSKALTEVQFKPTLKLLVLLGVGFEPCQLAAVDEGLVVGQRGRDFV